jgi:hypothetical protein
MAGANYIGYKLELKILRKNKKKFLSNSQKNNFLKTQK